MTKEKIIEILGKYFHRDEILFLGDKYVNKVDSIANEILALQKEITDEDIIEASKSMIGSIDADYSAVVYGYRMGAKAMRNGEIKHIEK